MSKEPTTEGPRVSDDSVHEGSGPSYWSRKIRLIGSLLAVWAFVAFGMSIFGAEALNEFSLGGIPFGFWMAQQGSIFIFVLLILIYALASDRLDDREARLSDSAK